ncbi:MAG: hypothetical protein FWF08_03170 [Oscillospiraceae bacterium]|nr:hypothetical protein [Oscillospiraceae bacterium]
MLSNKNSLQIGLSGIFEPFLSLLKDGKTADEKVALSLAIGMYLAKQATMAKAVELAGTDKLNLLWELFDRCYKRQASYGRTGNYHRCENRS